MNTKLLITILIIFSLISCNNSPKLGTENRIVKIETEYGNIKIKLYDQTPLHRDNFIKLVSKKYFDGTLFHRVINGFMIQGGDPDSKNAPKDKQLGEGGPGYQLKAEFNSTLFHKKGALAAAREGDIKNPEKKSAGSQFYIAQGKIYTLKELEKTVKKINQNRQMMLFHNIESKNKKQLEKLKNNPNEYLLAIDSINKLVDSLFIKEKLILNEEQKKAYTSIGGIPHLDGQYTVFGEVIEGLEIIDKISSLKTDKNDRPIENVKMKLKLIK